MHEFDSNFAVKGEACERRLDVVQLVLQLVAMRAHILENLILRAESASAHEDPPPARRDDGEIASWRETAASCVEDHSDDPMSPWCASES